MRSVNSINSIRSSESSNYRNYSDSLIHPPSPNKPARTSSGGKTKSPAVCYYISSVIVILLIVCFCRLFIWSPQLQDY